jgi:hypothetical protein
LYGQEQVRDSFVPSQFNGKGIAPNDKALDYFAVSYSNVRLGGGLSVSPTIPYIKVLHDGGPIKGLFTFGSPFSGDAVPEVSFKFNNTTRKDYYATGITLKVIKSTKINLPIPIILIDLYNPVLRVINYGSADISNVTADIALVDENACDGPFTGSNALPLVRIPLSAGVGTKGIFSGAFVEQKIPPLYSDAPRRCAFGFLNYESNGLGVWRIPFSTIVFHRPPSPLGQLPLSQTYDVNLVAGRQNYSVEVPISQMVPSGQADFIKLRIASDTWSTFDMEVAVNSSDGQAIPLGKLHLEYFSAGRNLRLAHSQFRKLSLPLTAALKRFVVEVTENPFNREDVVVVVKYPEYNNHFEESRAALETDLAQLLRRSRSKARMCIVTDTSESDCYDMRDFGY